MKCPRCNNEDAHAFYTLQGRVYCRKCIRFHRVFIDEVITPKPVLSTLTQKSQYHMSFALSDQQTKISDALMTNYDQKINTLVLAVCGSGKTEITFAVINEVINRGGRVCFAIPRKALCIELYNRLTSHFSEIVVGLFYGGCQMGFDAPLVVCTTHQLYRFIETPFDLMILDEADAFPFYGDAVLNAIFLACTKHCYIKLSATLSGKDIHDEAVLIMNRRYHGYDLPVPRIIIIPRCLWLIILRKLLLCFKKRNQRALLYVPLKKSVPYYCERLSSQLRVMGVSSDSPKINEAVDRLRNRDIDCLITTTILERGITVENVQVIVIQASHPIFDERTLLQIAGRVGRSPRYPEGNILFIDACFSKEMKACISTIKKLNKRIV